MIQTMNREYHDSIAAPPEEGNSKAAFHPHIMEAFFSSGGLVNH
jgi:hypothetical protein